MPPVSHRAPPNLSVKICIFEGSGRLLPIQYKWSKQRKINLTGKSRDRYYCSNNQKKFAVNRQPVIVSLALREGVACNIIFSWTFLQTIKYSIMTWNNDLVSVIMGEKLKLEIMVPQISKETPKTSEGIPF